MTTQIIGLKSFALGAQDGRTEQPLNLLGVEMLTKLTNDDTSGAVAILHENLLPMSAPPFHRHSREDEWFYVLDGQITVQINEQQTILRTGSSAFAPRGTAGTIQNFGTAAAQMLVMVTPGRLQKFLEELSSLNKGLSTPDLVRAEQLMKQYGVELLGPPLA